MKAFDEILKRNFPNDDRMGFYVLPNIPSGKKGIVLNAFTSMAPADLVACHIHGNMLSREVIALTKDTCYYEKSKFLLEDIKSAQGRDRYVDVDVNQGGAITRHTLKADDEEAAKLLARVLDTVAFAPKADELMPEERDYEKEGFNMSSVDWLELRDEVMKTVDMLHARFQAGKLSLLEYESKKTDLLSRL